LKTKKKHKKNHLELISNQNVIINFSAHYTFLG